MSALLGPCGRLTQEVIWYSQPAAGVWACLQGPAPGDKGGKQAFQTDFCRSLQNLVILLDPALEGVGRHGSILGLSVGAGP